MKNPLLVITAPSCAGKDYLLKVLFQQYPDKFKNVVSATTRAPRSGEVDGVDYNFVSKEDFIELKRAGKLLESVNVYGSMYGTPANQIESARGAGFSPIKIVEPEGAKSIKAWCDKTKTPAVFVYLKVDRDVALKRFLDRFINDYAQAEAHVKEDLFLAKTDSEVEKAQDSAKDSIRKVIDTYTKRILKSMYSEQSWEHALPYDLSFGPMLEPEDSHNAAEQIVQRLQDWTLDAQLEVQEGQEKVQEKPGGGADEKDMAYVIRRTLLTAMDHAVDSSYLRDLILISESERKQQCSFDI